jgi:oxepin-CoA hydrolase/3-oxo-5,6-dehydrosuberyl-CoA semialdehyde dehydrogenase
MGFRAAGGIEKIMIELKSYLQNAWVSGKGKSATLVNPSTEEAVATSSTEGLDFKGALAFARDTGGKNLRKMSFKDRGEMIRAMSRAIHAHRDELMTLALQNGGNTRSDAKFDIDGASGTLAAYADLASTLGDKSHIVDGETFQLGRSARLFGVHVWTPREGVAVHVNAFNFPAWGLAEKAAVALLAGMPVVSKPATSTAVVSHRIVEILVAEKILPEGALSFIAGSAGDLLDHVGGQDVLAFTGAGSTGAMLRGGKAALHNSIRVNVEADSLNAAVLGPDADVDGELANLFIGDVVRDQTQKTGQKCTAIRRVYVPKEKIDAVIEKLKERLGDVKVGDPTHESVTMGPVATKQQLVDVRAGIERLESVAKIVFGSKTDIDPIGGTKGKGFFISPILLRGDNPDPSDPVHSHEVFGPVVTVMPYDGRAEHAARLVAGGGGGLVSSIYSDDKSFVKNSVLAIAPFHGRVTIGSSKVVGQTIPPGTVLPQLVHGGPGRAGSGEELGGKRGLAFYMQRTALQGDRALLESFV